MQPITAPLTHLDDVGSRSLLTFHSTTLAAMAMARSLPGTAAELHAGDPASYPARVSSEWLSGEHPAAYRRGVLGRFADGITEDGWIADVQLLASCQVLAEGVDIRGHAGVDGVVLADPRSSPVQIVQILGRALRQEPGEGKLARIIVPIYLAPGERPDAMMASSAYQPLVQVLQGLRAHDERIVQRLMLATRTASGSPTSVVELDPSTSPGTEATGTDEAGPSGAGAAAGHHRAPEPEGDVGEPKSQASSSGQQKQDAAAGNSEPAPGLPLLRFSRPRDPSAIARWLRTRVLQPDSEVWLTGYEALRQWVEQQGHAHVPATATIPLAGSSRSHGLGGWVSEQRRALKDGTLKPHRYRLLSELGMIWDVADAKFQNLLVAARAFHAKFGTLAAPRNAVIDEFAIGQALENLRKGAMVLTQARDDALRGIDPWWNPPWALSWQRRYAALADLLDGEEGNPDVPAGVRVHGIDIGTWLARQTSPAAWAQLATGQRELLEQLGVQSPTEPATVGEAGWSDGGPVGEQVPVVPGLDQLDAFSRGIAALRQYLAREGHLAVPRKHEEILYPAAQEGAPTTAGTPVTIRAGVWISNTRARRAKLTPEQREALAELGLNWATR